MPQKMIYGIRDGIIYAASAPATLRSFAGNMLLSERPVSMGQLRTFMGERLADALVLQNDEEYLISG